MKLHEMLGVEHGMNRRKENATPRSYDHDKIRKISQDSSLDREQQARKLLEMGDDLPPQVKRNVQMMLSRMQMQKRMEQKPTT